MIKKPENFMDLLELQKKLDETVYQERESSFIPRARTEFDLRMALDDEFNEFMKELPAELNFKYWKEIKHDPKKQLIEFVDCLFFILAVLNEFGEDFIDYDIDCFYLEFEKLTEFEKDEIYLETLDDFKRTLHDSDLRDSCSLKEVFDDYLDIAKWLGYSKEIILEAYWEKWNTNMKRINKDWSITSQN